METYIEATRTIPVLAEVDCLIVGGGAAGVATACTSSRLGASTLLVERYGFCGGAAVAGMSGTVCGLYTASTSGTPEQIVFGFADEFIRALKDRDGVTEPVRYGRTRVVVHDPLAWRETADAFLADAGVRVLYHTLCAGVIMDEGRVRGIVVERKDGRAAILAKIVVDASGDADVVYQAGLGYTMGQDGTVQNPTMMFRMLNVDIARLQAQVGSDTILPPSVTETIRVMNRSGRYALPRASVFVFPTPRPGEVLCNATRIAGEDGRGLNAAYTEDLTAAEIAGRKQVREYARFFRENLPGFEHAFVNDTGVQVGVRQTRSIDGRYRLANADVTSARKFADGIARCPWPIELHEGDKPKLVWIEDDYCEIPYRCLVPKEAEGLLVAGRCLSAEHEAVASVRVTAQCFTIGEAIGTAASLSLRQGVLPSQIAGEELRAELWMARD